MKIWNREIFKRFRFLHNEKIFIRTWRYRRNQSRCGFRVVPPIFTFESTLDVFSRMFGVLFSSLSDSKVETSGGVYVVGVYVVGVACVI